MAARKNLVITAPKLDLSEEILRDQLAHRPPEIVAVPLTLGPASAINAGMIGSSVTAALLEFGRQIRRPRENAIRHRPEKHAHQRRLIREGGDKMPAQVLAQTVGIALVSYLNKARRGART